MAAGMDGGRGWVYVVAGFAINFIINGHLKAYGLIMVELMDVLGTSAALTGWVSGLANAMSFVLAPFSSMLVNKYGHRKIVIVGGVLAAVGMTLSYFAVDLWILFITYGVIFGSGAGLLMVPSVSILPSYFEKRLSLAFGLVTVGTGLGSFCFPYIVQLLLDEYDYRNQFLVCGALTFNVIAAGLVFSPLRPSSSAAASADAGDGNTPRSDEKSRDKTVAGGGSDEKSRDKTVAGGGSDEKSRDKTVAGGGSDEKSRDKTVAGGGGDEKSRDETTKDGGTASPSSSSSSSSSSFAFHTEILADPRYLVYVGSLMMYIFGYMNNFTLLAVKANEIENASVSDATILAVLSATETILRLFWSMLWDIGVFRRPTLRRLGMAALTATGGLLMFFVGTIETSTGVVAWSAICGAVMGGSLTPIVINLVDMLGPDRMGDGLGFMMLAESIIMLLGPLLTGYLLDATGNVSSSYVALGFSLLASAGLCTTVELIDRWRGDGSKAAAEVKSVDEDEKEILNEGDVIYKSTEKLVGSATKLN